MLCSTAISIWMRLEGGMVMTKSILEIEAKIKELRLKESMVCDIGNDLRIVYLCGMEEALMWVIGQTDTGGHDYE